MKRSELKQFTSETKDESDEESEEDSDQDSDDEMLTAEERRKIFESSRRKR